MTDITTITRHAGYCLLHTASGATVRVTAEKARVISMKTGIKVS